MKIFKKIGLGFCLLAIFSFILSSNIPKVAAISGFTKTQIQNAKFTLTDINHVQATIGGKTVNFTAAGTYPKDFTRDPASGDIESPPADDTHQPVAGYQYFAEADLSAAASSRPFCNNRQQVNGVGARGGKYAYILPQVGVSFTGDLSQAQSYKITYANINFGSKDASGGTGTDANCAAATPNQSTIQLAAQTSTNIGNATAGAVCSTPGAISNSGNLTCGSCSSQGCVWSANNTNTGDSNACESTNYNLNWLLCGVLSGLDDFMNKINDFIESQLTINIKDTFNPSVHQAWGVFRTLSSALLVIIMLIMVFSQAISAGPFDAYTVRKMLPRILAAVIFIQLSWSMGMWAVGIANDLGKGIAQLISVPFGGTHKLAFDQLIGSLGAAAPFAFQATTFLAVGLAVIINPFGALLLALFIIMGALTATVVLLVRQIVILGAIILFPLALIAWILPGTQKYWKMLWDNFIKALLLFPIVIAMIYIGRVFAWMVASQGGTPGFFDMVAVAVGFFGPYFLLPKAFNWGGSILSMANRNIEKGASKLSEKPKKYINTRQEELKHQRAISSANRLRDWERQGKAYPASKKLASIIRGDKFKSGEWDPSYTLMPISRKELKRQQEEKVTKFRSQSIRAENEEREAASLKLQEEASHASPGNEDKYYQSIFNDTHRSIEERIAAMDLLAEMGGEPNFDFILQAGKQVYATGTDEEKTIFSKFASRNAGKLFPKMPHLPFYKPLLSAAGGLKPQDFATLSVKSIEDMIKDLKASTDPTAPAALNNVRRAYEEALRSPTVAPNISFDMRNLIEGSIASPTGDKTGIVQRTLPNSAVLTDPVQKDAYIARLRTDQSARQALAEGLAYSAFGIPTPTTPAPAERASQLDALAYMQSKAAVGSKEDKEAFNSLIDQIEQAYHQRVNEIVERQTTPGMSATDIGDRRNRAQATIAPEIVRLEGMRLI